MQTPEHDVAGFGKLVDERHASKFEALAKELHDIETRLVEEHWREVSYLQSQLQQMRASLGECPPTDTELVVCLVGSEAPAQQTSAKALDGSEKKLGAGVAEDAFRSVDSVRSEQAIEQDKAIASLPGSLQERIVDLGKADENKNDDQRLFGNTFVLDESEQLFPVEVENVAKSKAASLCKARGTKSVIDVCQQISRELDSKVLRGTLSPSGKLFKIHDCWDLSEQDLLRVKNRFGFQTPRSNTNSHPRLSRGSSLFFSAGFDADWFMIDPRSKQRATWDTVALTSLLFDLVTIPMNVFGLPQKPFLYVMEILTACFWTVDIGASFITGVLVDGVPEMRFQVSSRKYMRTWLPIDVMLTTGEWFVIFLASNDGVVADSAGLIRLSRGQRFARLGRVWKLLRLIKLSKIMRDFDERITGTAFFVSYTVSKLVFVMILVAHLLACAWYAIGNNEHGWVYVEGIVSDPLADRYLYSFQWSVTRLHPSNMSESMRLKTAVERSFAIITTIFATVAFAWVLSSVTNTVAEMKKSGKEHTKKVRATRNFCRQHKISRPLIARVQAFVEFDPSVSRVSSDAQVMEKLPASLLIDLRHEAWAPVISRNHFFMKIHRNFVMTERDICHHCLEEVVVFIGDTLFTTGDACDRMLFLLDGKLSYMLGRVFGYLQETQHDDDEVLHPGDWLCEAALWTSWENCGELTAQKSQAPKLLSLDTSKFVKVLSSHEISMKEASIYAKAYVEVLNGTDRNALSDVGALDQLENTSDGMWGIAPLIF